MRDVGRNDPCPCGSGIKHKRCCLELGRSALSVCAEGERRVAELGDYVREVARSEWLAAFDDKIGPLPRFGGVFADEAAWLDTWLVCDEPILDGRTALDVAAAARIDEQLRGSVIGGWWARGAAFPLPASHWRFEEPVILHCLSDPLGELAEGALVVGRGIELGGGHVALVGRPVVVDEQAIEALLALLGSAPAEALCAAVRWPEERTHTAEGELVRQCSRFYEVADIERALALLRASPLLAEDDEVMTSWDDDVAFDVLRVNGGAPCVPPPEPGVIWELCHEDVEDPPLLGELTVSREEGEISVSAPTAHRADLLLEVIPAEVRRMMGALRSEDLDMRDVLPRQRRERIASFS